MKKSVFSISIAALLTICFSLVSCPSPEQGKPDNNPKNPTPSELDDKVIWQAQDANGEEFISISDDVFENDYEIKSDFEGKLPRIDFGDGLDLTGYKYLNIEFYCPEGDYHLVGFTGLSFDPYEKVLRTRASGSKEPKVIQGPFGVNHGEWPSPGEDGKPKVQANVSNKLNYLYVLVYDEFGGNDWALVPGVRVYVKKVTATNTKFEKDPAKDFTVFSAVENDGHKITTVKEDMDGIGNVILFGVDEPGEMELDDYKYLNFELYSPNINNHMLHITGWSQTYRTGEKNEKIVHMSSYITNESQVYQVPFNSSVHDKILSHLWFYVQDVDSESGWIDNIDIYVKRIWATNTQIKSNMSKDLDLYISSTDEGVHVVTKENDSVWMPMNDIYLQDYKYINVELYGQDAENKIAAFDGWNGDVSVISLEGFLDGSSKTNPKVIQAKIKENTLGGFCIYARENGSDNWAEKGVDIYIKRIYATNNMISSDTATDRILFAPEGENGFKTVTPSDRNLYRNIYLGTNDLTGYKYLNVELGIPNRNKNYYFTVDGWGENERVATSTASLLDDTVVLQSLFGTNNGTWNDWVDNKTVVKQSTSNILANICISVREAEENQNLPNVEFYVKRVWATNTKLENDITNDKIVYKSSEAGGYKFSSKEDWAGFCIFGNNPKGYDLTGYKYLNIELYSPNSVANSVTIDCWGDDERVASFNSILTSEPLILQSTFGKNYNEANASNILGFINYGAHYYEQKGENQGFDWPLVKDVDIYIKRIWATNTEYVNDGTKDRNVFVAAEENGYKMTTETEWLNFSVGARDLTGYKYLNMELYSPNSGNYDIKIDGWSTERVSVIDTKLTSTSIVVQVPFGVNRGTWEGEIDGVWQNEIPSTNNGLLFFALGAHLGDNWDLKDGIDIYIKRIWVTNAELQ